MPLLPPDLDELPLTVGEKMILDSERLGKRMNIHLDAAVDGRLDPVRLEAAVAAAMAVHPLASMAVDDPRSFSPRWRRQHIAGCVPVPVIETTDADDFQRRQDEILSTPIPVTRAPLFRVCLIRRPHEDHLAIVANHVLCDGGGVLALLRTISEVYGGTAGTPTETNAVDIVQRRSDLAVSGAAVGPGRSRRLTDLRRVTSSAWSIIASPRIDRIASERPRHGPPVPDPAPHDAQGVVNGVVDASTLDRLRKLAVDGSSLNDVLMVALHQTIDRWNLQQHGRRAQRIRVSFPIGMRERTERDRLVANMALQGSVDTTLEQRDGRQLLPAVTQQTAGAKAHPPPMEPAFAAAVEWLPTQLRLPLLQATRRLTRDRSVATSRLSNLGRVDEQPFRGIGLRSLWFAPTVGLPQGAAVGILLLDQTLHVAVAFSYGLFDAGAANRFLEAYLATLERETEVI